MYYFTGSIELGVGITDTHINHIAVNLHCNNYIHIRRTTIIASRTGKGNLGGAYPKNATDNNMMTGCMRNFVSDLAKRKHNRASDPSPQTANTSTCDRGICLHSWKTVTNNIHVTLFMMRTGNSTLFFLKTTRSSPLGDIN